MKKLVSLFLCLILLFSLAPTALAASDSFTLMIYLCGTDLESNGGAATADLIEMIASGILRGGALTVLVQTGGTNKWHIEGIANETAERWTLSEEGLELIDNVGAANMGDPETLSSFLSFGFENYPADRYGLIMWDHGSGATGGLCYDEITGDSLDYTEIYQGLETVSQAENYQPFAFIGFDACLMASYELAIHLAPFADYMIASEELEPGTGWGYDGWLPSLISDPAIKIERLGKKIVDSYISSTLAQDSSEYATLSVCDLSKIDALRNAIEGMGDSLSGEIDTGNFATISRIRQNVRSFGEIFDHSSDMVDLTVFADAFGRFDKINATAIKDALADVVVYSRHTNNLTNVSGLSILVPFATRATAGGYMPAYDSYKLSPSYDKFVSETLTGISSGCGSNPIGNATVNQQSIESAQIDWFSQYANDPQSYQESADTLMTDSSSDSFSLNDFLDALFSGSSSTSFNSDYDDTDTGLWGDLDADSDTSFATNNGVGSSIGSGLPSATTDTPTDPATVDPTQVNIQTANGDIALDNPFAGSQGDNAYTVTLTSEQLQNLGKVEANLMMNMSDPDFECYVELGYVQDVVVDWQNGKIYGMFDGTWATLDGQMVCMYDQIANENYIRSLVPVTLNGDHCYLLIVFDADNPSGRVIGITEGYTDAGMPVRGYTELAAGDVIVPQYDLIYWDENEEQQTEPFEGDPITVGEACTLPFGYDNVESDAEYAYSFCLTDIYGDSNFTNFIPLSF